MKKIVKNSLLISMGLFLGLTASSYGALEKITVFKDNVTSIFIDGKKIYRKNQYFEKRQY